jgi:hypothetical protein
VEDLSADGDDLVTQRRVKQKASLQKKRPSLKNYEKKVNPASGKGRSVVEGTKDPNGTQKNC